MGWIVLLGLLAWPILEIAVFVQVGEGIGWLNAILLFVGAGVVGLWLLRAEGVSLLLRARAQMQSGVAPVNEAFDALCLVAGGVLLLLPGFLSDIAALLLFLPPTRAALKHLIARHAIVHHARYGSSGPGPAPDNLVIDGEFEEVPPAAADRLPSSPSSSGGAAPGVAGDVVPKRE